MPILTPYALYFHSGLHLGTRGITLEESGVSIPSDTLFSALMDVHLRAGGDPVLYIAPFGRGDPPFMLTSAFPVAGAVRFYPMPVDTSLIFSAAALKEHGKKLKRIRYLSEQLLLQGIVGNVLDEYLPMNGEKGLFLQGNTLWLSAQEQAALPETWRTLKKDAFSAEKVWAAGSVPRVTLNRLSSASQIYHAGRVTFAEGCGLWFGVWWRNPNENLGEIPAQTAFINALTLLQDDGLGGERTSGYGAFRFQSMSDAAHLPDSVLNAPGYLLSRYSPQPNEIGALQDEGASYTLTSVGGWMRTFNGAAQRRKRLMLVTEGSLLFLPKAICGKVHDVAGDGASHEVYRAGFALVSGWQKKQEA